MNNRVVGIIVIVLVIAIFVGGGWWIWTNLTPSKSELNAKKDSLKKEIIVVDTNILDNFDTSQVDQYKTFGTFPITIPADLLGRNNPFGS